MDLREVVMAALHLDAYMVVTLEKFTVSVARPSGALNNNRVGIAR